MAVSPRVAIVGGGSCAFALICFLDAAGCEVSLLSHRPADWQQIVTLEYRLPTGETRSTFRGRLARISDDPRQIVGDADIVFLAMPVSAYPGAIAWIGDSLPRGRPVFVGVPYGQGGFNWMTAKLRRCPGTDFRHFAFGLLPWICRTAVYGHRGITYGPKARNAVATATRDDFEWLNEHILPALSLRPFGCGSFYRAGRFMAMTLSADNQIIHPARMYSLNKEAPLGWDSRAAVPRFYRDFDRKSAEMLRMLDAEYEQVRRVIRDECGGEGLELMLGYLPLEHWSYGRSSPDIHTSFCESPTLGAIETPVEKIGAKWFLARDHRFFRDDIDYGLGIARSIARRFGIGTPMIDEITGWALDYLGNDPLGRTLIDAANGGEAGSPFRYGIDDAELFS